MDGVMDVADAGGVCMMDVYSSSCLVVLTSVSSDV